MYCITLSMPSTDNDRQDYELVSIKGVLPVAWLLPTPLNPHIYMPGDSLWSLFNMYLKITEEEDNKRVQLWQKDAKGIIVFIQCQTAKINNFASTWSRFFQGKWTLELWLEGLNTSKNTLLRTFPCFLPLDNFFLENFYIMHYQISKSVVTFITKIIICHHSARFTLRLVGSVWDC